MHGWIIWLLSALFMCYKYAIEVSPSVMTNDLMREYSLTGAQMGNFAATFFYAYLLMQIPAGLLIDKWGPRRVTTIAIALCGVGMILFAQAETFAIACIGRFITGVGAAFAAVNCLKLIANWFPSNKFALMAGLMMSVGMLGAVGGQGPLSSFIHSLDWRSAMQMIAYAGFGLAVLFFLVVKDKAPNHRKITLNPPKNFSVLKNLKQLFRNPQSWYLSLYSGFAFAPVSAFGGLWGVPYLSQAFDLSTQTAAHAASLIFIGFAVGCPLFGWFSDRIGKRRPVMFLGTLIATVCLTIVIYCPFLPLAFICILLFLFGFSISAFLLCFTMIKEINYAALAATSIGFMNAFDALFGAFTDPLTGKVLDTQWAGVMVDGARVFSLSAYHLGLSLLVGYLLLSLFMIKPIRETHCKQVFPTGMP